MSKSSSAAQLRDLLCDLFRGSHDLIAFLTAHPRLRGLLYEELGESSSDLRTLAEDVIAAALLSDRDGVLLDALAVRFPGQRAAIDALRSDRTPRGAHLVGGLPLPIAFARGLALLLLAGALALPWLATWQGALERPAQASPLSSTEPEAVQYRPEEVLIPGGRFWMGITAEEPQAFAEGLTEEERSLMDYEVSHEVEVGALVVAQTEVTLGQWEAVMGTRPNDCAYGCADDHPVSNVTWKDACAYTQALTELENGLRKAKGESPLTACYVREDDAWTWPEDRRGCTGFRLPTEAEWEYSARAGTSTAYSFGNGLKDLCAYGNIVDETAKRERPGLDEVAPCDDGYAGLAPVGKFAPNPWGLHDAHGNVWEWVWDWYGDYPTTTEGGSVEESNSSGAPGDRTVNVKQGYAGPESGEYRVMRGGSFRSRPGRARSAGRGGEPPRVRDPYGGFRVVRHPL